MRSFEHPGVTISELVDQAAEEPIRRLIGESTVSILQALDPKLTEPDTLRAIAKRLIDPSEALRNAETRERLVETLPLDKAQELAHRFELSLRGDLYKTLQGIATRRDTVDELRRFFGVVDEERASGTLHATVGSLTPRYSLFSYQRDAAVRALGHLRQIPRKVLLHMPTGAGKTRTAMHIVSRHLLERGPTLVCWLAQSAELLEQAAESFEEAWTHLGDRSVDLVRLWGDRDTEVSSLRDGLIVAGLGKMYAAYRRDSTILHKLGDHTSLTVVDEAHQIVAPTHSWVAEGLYTKQPHNALLGLTATPGRTWSDIAEDERLSRFFDRCKVVLEVEGYDDPVSYLIDQGFLARPKFRTLEVESVAEVSSKSSFDLDANTDYPEPLLDTLANSANRNIAIVRALEDMLTRHRRVLLFASSVAHARLMAAILVARGHEADVVTGETGPGTRRRLIRRFRSSDPNPIVLVNYGVLTTGFDAPNTSAALIARPTRSLVLYSQMVGRATRGPRVGGHEEAEIVTVIDTALPGFGSMIEAFHNWEDVWHDRT